MSSPSKQAKESKGLGLFKLNRKKPKQQGSEKSPTTDTTHTQDTQNAEDREAEGMTWDNHIDERSRD